MVYEKWFVDQWQQRARVTFFISRTLHRIFFEQRFYDSRFDADSNCVSHATIRWGLIYRFCCLPFDRVSDRVRSMRSMNWPATAIEPFPTITLSPFVGFEAVERSSRVHEKGLSVPKWHFGQMAFSWRYFGKPSPLPHRSLLHLRPIERFSPISYRSFSHNHSKHYFFTLVHTQMALKCHQS